MLIVLKLLGSIALLIYGMKVMSEALQKMAGPQLRHLLGAMTTNRFSGVATGALVTVAVQSSAATTVMTVSFVNAALLTLTQAISIIMGANIGTTMSAWIMSAGFSFNMADVVWPAFLAGIILIQLGKHRYIGDFLFGLSFLLFALGMLKQTGVEMDLASKPAGPRQQAGRRRLLLELQDQLRNHPAVPADRHGPDGDGAEFGRTHGHYDGLMRNRRHLHLSGYRTGDG